MQQPSTEGAGQPDDGALIREARQGSLDAFNGLVELHQRGVYNLCLRMLGSATAAEDAAQDAFLSAFRGMGTFKGVNFRAWLMRIAANACTDELRRRARRPAVSIDARREDEPPIDVPDPGAGPEAMALRAESAAGVQAALLRLPPDQRLAVILCDLQGYGYEEIARAMGTSIGTVKSRIARGREKLRRELPQREEQSGGADRHE
ncbi:MAG TPA: sigma-70 family RNA polymerase sigma factor [Dehalococcoidia bacterium]|nr:sigma-70 family RNA polymerase sigma factor [Dehalococcoidia bacterium]